jgi:chloramphenicol-sensitive protein RarD
VTAFPLACFASAASRLPLSVLGFFQYIAPCLSLGLAVWLYDESFTPVHGVTFSFIGSALVIFSWDGFRGRVR